MSIQRIRTFSYHYRQKYGYPVGKIPIDLGVICPNRKSGGCIYCAPAAFTPGYLSKGGSVNKQIERGKRYLLKNRFTQYLAYFQQETSTAYPKDEFLRIAEHLLNRKNCIGLIISTRPDFIEPDFLEELHGVIAFFSKECLIELGVQSAHERSLRLLNRNHSYGDVQESAELINHFDAFQLGAHLILGIPGEDREQMLQTISRVAALNIDALKLHHLQVINDTPLHEMYLEGEVTLFSKNEYLEFMVDILPMIPPNVVIHRLWASSHPAILVAPKWNVLATELSQKLNRMLEVKNITQGCFFSE